MDDEIGSIILLASGVGLLLLLLERPTVITSAFKYVLAKVGAVINLGNLGGAGSAGTLPTTPAAPQGGGSVSV